MKRVKEKGKKNKVQREGKEELAERKRNRKTDRQKQTDRMKQRNRQNEKATEKDKEKDRKNVRIDKMVKAAAACGIFISAVLDSIFVQRLLVAF